MRKKDDDLKGTSVFAIESLHTLMRAQADVEEDHTFQLFAAIPYLAT